MNRLEYDIVALLVCALTLIIFYAQRQVRNRRSRVFHMLLWIIAGSTFFSLFTSVVSNSLQEGQSFVVLLLPTLFLVFHITIPVLFCLYLLALTGHSRPGALFRTAFFLPWGLLFAFVLLNVSHELIFFVNESNRYERGSAHFALYFVSMCYLVIMLSILLRNFRKMPHFEVVASIAALVLPLIAMLIQFLVPVLILENFAFALVALFFLLTVQNNADSIDGITGLYNRETFLIHLKDSFLRKQAFSVVLVRSRELDSLGTYLDNQTYNRLLHSLSGWLMLLAGKKFMLFSIDDGLFAFITAWHTGEDAVGELALEIVKRSGTPWISGINRFEIPLQTAIIRCPADCAQTSQIIDYVEQFILLTEMFADRHILYGRDFIPDKHLRQAMVAYALQESIDARFLELEYQPVLSKNDNSIIAVEVLVTLTLPDGSVAHQSEVLHIAERTGLGQQLGELIMDQAFGWFVTNNLPERGIPFLQVRLLESQCIETDWPGSILRIAKRTGMDVSRLCIEITETSVVNTSETLKFNMEILIARKVCFALDDYGSGYTDFGEILEMPFSVIKLDKKMVHAGLKTGKGERLLQGTISLFQKIGWPIVAEGIETEDHARMLSSMGCIYLQGYWIGYPVPGDELLRQFPRIP